MFSISALVEADRDEETTTNNSTTNNTTTTTLPNNTTVNNQRSRRSTSHAVAVATSQAEPSAESISSAPEAPPRAKKPVKRTFAMKRYPYKAWLGDLLPVQPIEHHESERHRHTYHFDISKQTMNELVILLLFFFVKKKLKSNDY